MSSGSLNLTRNQIADIVGDDPRAIRAFEMLFSAAGGAAWVDIDFTGSDLSDILLRPHSALQLILGADDTDTNATKNKHVSNAMVKDYNDHVLITDANPHGTDHDQLDAIGQADETSSDTVKDKHVSNNQLKVFNDHWLVVSASSDITAGTDQIILADASSGKFQITMPPISTSGGFRYIIKKVDSTYNAVTIVGDGLETVEDDSSLVVLYQYDSPSLVPSGTNWSLV